MEALVMDDCGTPYNFVITVAVALVFTGVILFGWSYLTTPDMDCPPNTHLECYTCCTATTFWDSLFEQCCSCANNNNYLYDDYCEALGGKMVYGAAETCMAGKTELFGSYRGGDLYGYRADGFDKWVSSL